MNSIAPSNSTVASAGLGVPIAIVFGWLLEVCCHDIKPMNNDQALALGAIISTFVGYFFNGGRRVHVEQES